MTGQAYREALEYSKVVEEDKNGKPLLSEGAWLKQKRKQAATHKLVESQKPKEPKHQTKVEFMEEATVFWGKARKFWSEEVIEEVLDKARVNTR